MLGCKRMPEVLARVPDLQSLGHAMLAADGGLPYIHVYESDKSGDWGGERWPIASKRVMSDEVFNHGRQNHISGGAKVSTKL